MTDTERAAFEHEMRKKLSHKDAFDRHEGNGDVYAYLTTRVAWEAWQARAALAASQEKAEVVGRKIGYIKIGTDGCPRAQLTTSYDAAGNVWADATPIYDAPVAAQAHPDDAAVDRFAIAMKEKLAIAREKGRSGWEKMDPAELSLMLRQHVEKGDPRDVANFCMFLWALGERIGVARASEPASPQVFGGGNG